MTIFDILKYLFLSNYVIILGEFLYSKYKNDGIYSNNGTFNNVLNGIILYTFSPRSYALYLVFFMKYYGYFNASSALNFSLIAFIPCLFFVDFMYYIFHRVHHNFEFLWVFHSVHHSDKNLNLSTSNRISWFEQIYIYLFFIPVLLAGFHPLNIFFTFHLLTEYQFYCHSQYFKFPKIFNYIFVTPYNHKTHHDEDYRYQGSNFGGVFSIWDRMFGTYTVDPPENFKPGVKNWEEENFIKFEFVPIIKYYKKLGKKWLN